MKHKTLTVVLTVLMSMVASAAPAHTTSYDEEESLYLYTKSSTESVVYSMNELRKITFSNKGVQMWTTNWPTEYSYSQFRVITVNSQKEGTGIKDIAIGSRGDDDVVYYDLQGRKVSSPRQGIYILRSADGTTRKVLIK